VYRGTGVQDSVTGVYAPCTGLIYNRWVWIRGTGIQGRRKDYNRRTGLINRQAGLLFGQAGLFNRQVYGQVILYIIYYFSVFSLL